MCTLRGDLGGLFVDKNRCLHVVLTRPDTQERISVFVHGMDVKESTCKEWTGAITDEDEVSSASTGRVVLSIDDRVVRHGAWDGRDELSWDDGDVWHRLRVSEPQWRILGGRPYVSGLFVILALVCYVLATVYRACCYVARRMSEALVHLKDKSSDRRK
jgi:hypothetical protein